VRDSKQAVSDATRACQRTSWKAPEFMDTLAAACAESGDFPSAMRWDTQALELARENETLTREIRAHLDLYRRRQPLRDTPSTEPAAEAPTKAKD
jgi:hypothetical protein